MAKMITWGPRGERIVAEAPKDVVDSIKAPRVSSKQIEVERDRRLGLGTVVDIPGYGPVPVQGRLSDMVVLSHLKDTADDMLSGNWPGTIRFRDRDNVNHDLTPSQVVDLVTSARQAAQAIYDASWALKDQPSGPPADYSNSKYWETK